MIKTKASVEQTLNLGKWLFSQGVKSEQVVLWLKSKGYTLRGVYFNATYVAFVVAGIELATTKEAE